MGSLDEKYLLREIGNELSKIANELKEQNRVLRRMCEASIFDREPESIMRTWVESGYLDSDSQE